LKGNLPVSHIMHHNKILLYKLTTSIVNHIRKLVHM